MITSNSIIQRNAVVKDYAITRGVLSERKTETIDVRNTSLIEIQIYVEAPSTETSPSRQAYMDITLPGHVWNNYERPQLLDENGDEISKNIFHFNTQGWHTLYADTRGFNTILLRMYPGDNGEADVILSTVLYADKFTALQVIEERNRLKKAKEKENRDVLLEGEKFRFVKKNDFVDVWDNQGVRFTGALIYLTTDGVMRTFSAQPALDMGGGNIVRISLIPNNSGGETKTVIALRDGQVYHNYANGGGIEDWAETKFWEARGTVRKIPVKTMGEVSANKRFDPTLIAERYLRNDTKVYEGETFIEYQDKPNFNVLGHLTKTKKMVVFGTYTVGGDRVGVWVTTDGGANFVLAYDFQNTSTMLSEPINTSTFDDYTSGLTIKKVNMVYPTLADKEPAIPFTYEDVAFSGITKGTTTTVNAVGHGLKTGDMVLLTGTAQDDNWNALTCDNFDGDGFTQNIYSVVAATNSFQLKTYMGSYDRPLICRHIHSTNEHISGAVIATGEEYPNGWFLHLKQKYKDRSGKFNAFNILKGDVTRLNSAKEGIQRACGLIMDNAIDPNIIFNSDTTNPNFGMFKIDGRTTDLPGQSAAGIWKGKLSNIDDWSKFECVCDIPEPAIWMFKHGKVIVGYYQLGGNVVSVDGGETWEYFKKGLRHFNGLLNDKIVIGNGYEFEWK